MGGQMKKEPTDMCDNDDHGPMITVSQHNRQLAPGLLNIVNSPLTSLADVQVSFPAATGKIILNHLSTHSYKNVEIVSD